MDTEHDEHLLKRDTHLILQYICLFIILSHTEFLHFVKYYYDNFKAMLTKSKCMGDNSVKTTKWGFPIKTFQSGLHMR